MARMFYGRFWQPLFLVQCGQGHPHVGRKFINSNRGLTISPHGGHRVKAWAIKSKNGYLTKDSDEYGALNEAHIFRLKKDAEKSIQDGIDSGLAPPEKLARVEIKEVKP